MENSTMQEGINLYKNGKKTSAFKIFREVLKREPKNETAWLWLAACVEKPDQKKGCFLKVLDINPNNVVAQKAFAELVLQDVPDLKPVPVNGTVLKCPSCGSVMGKPDHTGLIQCGYCGTTITYHPPVEKVERKNVERFLEICKAALEGSNYDESLQYANKALEIDPDNYFAWVYKAISTFWQTTAANNRYDEALGYLNRAEKIDKDNSLTQETRDSLKSSQVQWYIHLGDQQVETAVKIYNIYDSNHDLAGLITSVTFGDPNAKENSKEYFVKAMQYYLTASYYNPNHFYALYCIRNLVRNTSWISWPPDVHNKVSRLYKMEQRESVISRLPEIRKELKQAQTKLAKVNKEKGLFSGMKKNSAMNKVKSLKTRIAQCEQIANSEIN